MAILILLGLKDSKALKSVGAEVVGGVIEAELLVTSCADGRDGCCCQLCK